MTASQVYHRLAAWFVQENDRLPNEQEAKALAAEASALTKEN